MATNYFSRFNTYVYIEGREKPLTIYTAYIGNYKRLGQAMIEAAMLANPKVEIRGLVRDAYGLPPYGVFANEPVGNA